MSSHYVIYARRSSETGDKQVLSIEQQLEALRALAFSKGIEVAEELTESCSAREPGRPVFGELMKRVKRGAVDGILTWKLDRLARNMVDGGEIIYDLTEGKLKEIVTPEGSYTGTGDSKFMLAINFGAAAKYTDDLSAGVRRGRRDALRRGKVPGPVPLGYMKTHEHEATPGTGIVIADPERFETMKRVWKEALTGNANVTELWRMATAWGLTTRPTKSTLARPITLSHLYNLLRNPFYTGKIPSGHELFKGEHPPMVTEQEFQRVRTLLGHGHFAEKEPRSEALYHALLHCGSCGRMLTGDRHEKGGRTYTYYRCGRRREGYVQCAEPEVREEDLTRAIADELDHVTIDPMIRSWAFQAVAWWAGDNELPPEKLVRRAKAALARAERELETLTDLVVGDVISVDEYKVRRVNQVAKIDHLREALADPAEKLAVWKATQDELKQKGLRLGHEFRRGDADAKRKIVTRTCEDVLVLDRKPRLKLRTPFLIKSRSFELETFYQQKKDVERQRPREPAE